MQANALLTTNEKRSHWPVAAVAIAVFAALSVYLGFVSEGFLEADACTHYLFARFALTEWHYLFNVWGRPICTGLYAIPAYLGGREGVRIASMCVAVAIGLISMNIAGRQRYAYPILALLFVLGQPLVFLHSFSELTELPFALLVALALLAYQRRWWGMLAIVSALMPLSRPEGFGFLLIGAVGLVLHRKWWWLLVLPIPLVAWDILGWLTDYRQGQWWKWLIHHWPYAAKSLYQSGPIWFFVGSLPIITSPLVFPATLVGWWQSWRAGLGRGLPGIFASDDDAHRRRVELIIAGLPAFVLVVHSLLYWMGKMASNGEIRYLLVAAPMWGLIACRGWGWIFDRFQFRRVVTCAAVAILIPALANLYYPVVPLKFIGDWHEARAIGEWYKTTPLREKYPHLMAAHTGIYYFLDLDPSALGHVVQWTQKNADTAPAGTLLIWDNVYGLYNSDQTRQIPFERLEQAGWKEVPWPIGEARIGKDGKPAWRVYVTQERSTE